MKILKLTDASKTDLLNDLLKRSPNNYSQYEATVNEIIENVRINAYNIIVLVMSKY